MLLRRFTQHLKEQNWFAVGLDVIVVIVGLFLGMQVTEWNEERILAQQERKYLIALQEDLTRLNVAFEDKILFEDTKARLSSYTFGLLDQKDFTKKAKAIAAGMIGLADRRTVNFISPVYVDLLSSGKLILIKNDSLRKEIISFFSNLEHYQRVLEKNSKQHLDERFIRFVNKHIRFHHIDELIPNDMVLDIDTRFLERTKRLLTTDVLRQDDPLLALDSEDPIWQDFKRELSWRAMISVADGDFVTSILKTSNDLSQKISDYLETINH